LYKGDKAVVDQLMKEPGKAVLPEREKALVDHCILLTREPCGVTEGHIEKLRGVGFEDSAILEITMISSQFGYFNRVANGLNIPLEENVMDISKVER